MAFVDLVSSLEAGTSTVAPPFPPQNFHPPTHSLPPPTVQDTNPAAPPFFSSYPPTFCPHCQFSSNFSMSGVCINCNMPIPISHSSLGPPIHQSPAMRPPLHHLQSHNYKELPMGVPNRQSMFHARPPVVQSSVPFAGQPSTLQSSMTLMPSRNLDVKRKSLQKTIAGLEQVADGFRMTSLIDTLSDVLEPQDLLGQKINAPAGQEAEKILTVSLDGDTSCLTSPLSGPSQTCSPHDYSPIIPKGITVPLESPAESLPSSCKTTPPDSNSNSGIQDIVTLSDEELEACSVHSDEKLTHFCPACVTLVCQECLLAEHTQHSCLHLQEAFRHFKPNLENLLGKSQVDKDLLQDSLAETEKMSAKVSKKQQEAVGEVLNIFQAHREVVDQREQDLIDQINEISRMRISSLSKDKETISQALDSVQSLLEEGKKLLQEGSKSKMLVAHYKLNSKLQECQPFTTSRSPSEDDSFVLKTNTLSVQSALKTLCLFTTAPYPPLCTVIGEGLFFPRINKLCTVILAAKDRAGQPCVEGGERLFVQLKSVGSSGATVPVDFRDNSDGTYSINFRPQTKGEHQLVIAIRGQHIQGSPFTLFVDSGREYGQVGVLTQVFGSEGSQNGQFCRPWGICCDQQGNIIVGDRSNHRVQVFDMNGAFKHKFGSEGVRPGQFNRPAGVAVTKEGHVVVADKDNHRIQVLKIDGTFLFMFGSKGGNDGQMIYPYDVTVNQFDGRIAVTDTGNHRLLIFNNEGILLGKFGYKGYLCGHFDSPRGIAFNDDGHIIVSDFNVHHILVIHPDGTTARILGSQGSGSGQFMRPQGITVDHMGNFIVADTRNHRIVIMHRSGHFVAKFGTSGSGPGQFDRPTSVAVLPDGRVAVVDFGNSRIQIF